MEEGTSTSLKEGNEIAEPKRWTKDLNGLPTFTYEILTNEVAIRTAPVSQHLFAIRTVFVLHMRNKAIF